MQAGEFTSLTQATATIVRNCNTFDDVPDAEQTRSHHRVHVDLPHTVGNKLWRPHFIVSGAHKGRIYEAPWPCP